VRLSVEQCREEFAKARVARLATIAQDGSPRLVPITFAVAAEIDGPTVVFSAVDHRPKSTTALVRLRRIEREPRVSLLADEYSEDWTNLWWVRADARAEILAAGARWEIGVALLQEKYEQYRVRPPADAVIRFVVEDWSGWSASERRTT